MKSTPEPSVAPAGPDAETIRRFRIGAVLLALFALLVLVALLTYTSRDEANAQLTLRDVIGVIRGDEALRVRFETTHNWLGLLGAVISHWMYTSTVGIWSISLPVLLLLASADLFRYQRITPLLRKRTVAVVCAAIATSALVGTLQLVPWMANIGVVFSGAIGQFLAATVSQFIGTIGSLLTWLVALGFIAVFGFDVQPAHVQSFLRSIRLPQRKQHANDSEEAESSNKHITVEAATKNLSRPADGPLSATVKIVRPSGTKPSDQPPASAEQQKSTSASHTSPNVQRFDLDEVKRRLVELHPNRDILRSVDKGPAEPGDVPELPLFLGDDDDADAQADVPSLVPSRQPLVVNVEESASHEPEVQLSNVTLYDEDIAYKPPTLSLLVEGVDEVSVDDEELRVNAQILQDKLETFRVKIENLTVQPGPVVTQYEFVPASGIKVSQIESLADDIALALKAPAVRVQAPVPGKGTVGIEIPNHKPALVRFSSIIKSPKYHNPDIKLPIALGKTAVGEVYCADLTKMPHLLIAGATGKGKSVGINTLIASLVYRMHPRDLKFVIIDPKRVEMTLYRELKNHFLAVSPDIDETIITEPINAVAVLKSTIEEMQMRYNILANAGQRNIADYNRKVKEGKIKDKDGFQHRPMPYIVVIIDELADLMMTAGKEVEEPIVRLAQLARAVGIHCVVATQRPSVDVVTGLIKANFPARIAYQVSARVDSRTILDTSGAEHLIGNGDMLFAPGNTPKPLRMQNAFISTEEVEAICEHIGKQRGYRTPYMLPSILGKKVGGFGNVDGDRDALFGDAARIFIQLQQASVSTLQRRLKVGYARAARIVDELESAGIVGPPDGSKGRAVLLQSESELESYL